MEQDVKEVKMYSDFKSQYALLAFDPALRSRTSAA